MTQNKDASQYVNQNKSAWNQFYSESPRLSYPDLMFVHFLTRYASKDPAIKNGIAIGEGDGAQALAIARRGVHMTCVDISEEAVTRLSHFAKEDGLSDSVTTCLGDQRDLSRFADNTFDLALSWSVISYLSVEDGQKALSEIHRVLRPGGHFIGLLESMIHTGYQQPGVMQLGPRTYQMPAQVTHSKPNVIMTYYDKNHVHNALSLFDNIALSHRVIELPPDCKNKIGQWMFHATKKSPL